MWYNWSQSYLCTKFHPNLSAISKWRNNKHTKFHINNILVVQKIIAMILWAINYKRIGPVFCMRCGHYKCMYIELKPSLLKSEHGDNEVSEPHYVINISYEIRKCKRFNLNLFKFSLARNLDGSCFRKRILCCVIAI